MVVSSSVSEEREEGEDSTGRNCEMSVRIFYRTLLVDWVLFGDQILRK